MTEKINPDKGNTALSINDRTEYGLIKTPLISSVSYFNLGYLKLCLGTKPTKASPWRRDCSEYLRNFAVSCKANALVSFHI